MQTFTAEIPAVCLCEIALPEFACLEVIADFVAHPNLFVA